MGGCRPLSDEEIKAILKALASNRYPLRDQALFFLGLRSGFRISELLSIRICDVMQNGVFSTSLTVARRHMKGKGEGRTVVVHPEAREAIRAWVEHLWAKGVTDPKTLLFKSRQGGNRAIARNMAWKILTDAYKACGLLGRLGTHSMRKTFAGKIHQALGKDIFKTQKAMGHSSPTSTASYLSVSQDEIDNAILKS